MNEDNSSAVLIRLIRELDIPVTRQTIRDELEKHPDYSSLLAVSDVLNSCKIPNGSYALTFEELSEVPVPFIAHTSEGGGEFVLVSAMDERRATVSNERWNKHQLNTEEFKRTYSGSILVAERDEESGEPDYRAKRRKEWLDEIRLPFVLSGLLLILAAALVFHSSFLASLNWSVALLTLFKSGGVLVSVLLLIQSVDANNPLIRRLCTGKNRDCNSILSSKAAKITGELSWSEAGFFYFAGTWLALLFGGSSAAVVQILAMLNLVSLPYTVYSIYYQAKVARQWCILCCIVQGLLWLEFFAFLPYLPLDFSGLNPAEWSSLLISMSAPVLAWILIKPYLLHANKIQPLRQQLRKFKYNTQLFQKMLNDQTRYALPDVEHSIILGNREAEHVITMVSNPYCQPCSRAHKALNELLSGKDNVKLQVIFTGNGNEKDPKTKVTSHFMSLKSRQDDVSLKRAMDDWYDQKQKNYDSWMKIYPAEQNIDVKSALEEQGKWCRLAEVKATPTIFLNGRRLPDPYQIEDIKYFI